MYCKKCGRQIPNGAATCPNCGASVAEMLQPTAQPGAQTGNQQEQAEHNWFDAGAGKESITGAKKPAQNKGWSNDEFYNRQNQPAPAAQQENLSVSNLNKKGWIALIAAFLVVIIVIGVIIYNVAYKSATKKYISEANENEAANNQGADKTLQLYALGNEQPIQGFSNLAGNGGTSQGIVTKLGGGTFDLNKIVEGTVVTIYYETSGTGETYVADDNMWLVAISDGEVKNLKGDEINVGGKNCTVPSVKLRYNTYHTKVQITYDDFVTCLGKNFAETVTALECCSDVNWKVSKVTLGLMPGYQYVVTDEKVLDPAFNEIVGAGWAQRGISKNEGLDLSDFVPGTLLTINYEEVIPDESGAITDNMWFVVFSNEDIPAFGDNPTWGRITGSQCLTEGVHGCYNGTRTSVQVTYEQFAQIMGGDFLKKINTLQVEGAYDWCVHSVTIGNYSNDIRKTVD